MADWLDKEIERKYHKVADLFPLLTGAEFDELKSDIKQNGLIEPIWLHQDGSIIDGRNRHQACIETETAPQFRAWAGNGSLVAFVVSLNLHRRHLSSSQRAVIALDVLPMLETEAKDRQSDAVHRRHLDMEKIPELEQGTSRDQAAEMFQTNPRYVQDAKAIQQQAPDLLESIKAGDISIPQAKETLAIRKGKPHVSNNSGNNEWYTPAKYIEAARYVMGGIDCDPASSEIANETVQATTFYTAEIDGLLQEWIGRVWMNPPYSQPLIAQFSKKLSEYVKRGDVPEACVLVNNATETGWFNDLFSVASSVCFVRRRIKFVDKDGIPGGAPLQGQAILYIGLNTDRFLQTFKEFGTICEVKSTIENGQSNLGIFQGCALEQSPRLI